MSNIDGGVCCLVEDVVRHVAEGSRTFQLAKQLRVVPGLQLQAVVAGLNSCNVLPHVPQFDVKDGQILLEVVKQTGRVVQPFRHASHGWPTLQYSVDIGCL